MRSLRQFFNLGKAEVLLGQQIVHGLGIIGHDVVYQCEILLLQVAVSNVADQQLESSESANIFE